MSLSLGLKACGLELRVLSSRTPGVASAQVALISPRRLQDSARRTAGICFGDVVHLDLGAGVDNL